MSDIGVNIPGLPPAGPITGLELTIVEQGGETKQAPVQNLRGPLPTLYVTGDKIGITGSNQVTVPGASVPEVVTAAGVGTLAVVSGKLVEIIVLIGGAGSSSVKVGTTVGGEEVVPTSSISSGDVLTFRVDYFLLSAGTLHFTGAGITAKIYLR